MEVIGFQARRSREGSSFSSQQVRITGRTFRGSDAAARIVFLRRKMSAASSLTER